MRSLIPAVTLLIIGCSFQPKPADPPEAGFQDEDRDGYPADVDCDDQDPEVNPSSSLGWWYPDADGDGYGDPNGELLCQGSAGAAPDATDCDDGDASVNPGASEVCDEGVDNDCDGLADDDDDSVDPASQEALFADADGDGYGDASRTSLACAPSADAVRDDTDCDDGDADINPGASETCADGLDNNCDGSLDECRREGELGVEDADAAVIGDSLALESGRALAVPGDVDGDGTIDLLIGGPATFGTCKDYPNGAAFLVTPPTSGAELLSDAASARLAGAAVNEQTGFAVAGADLDLDGYADLVIGAPYAAVGGTGTWAGRLEFVFGPVTSDERLGAAGADNYFGEKYDFAGYSVAVVGDMDEDGAPDVLVGSPGLDSGTAESEEGAVWLISQHEVEDYYLWSADYMVRGEHARDYLGKSVSGAGDLDGDGVADLMFSAPYDDTEADDAGAVYFLYGPLPSDGTRHDLSLTDAEDVRFGEAEGDLAGLGLASAGDLNGDGYDDVLIGAPGEYLDTDPPSESAGKAHLLLGPVNGTQSLYDPEATIENVTDSGNLGWRVCGPGDVDGDGTPDLLVSVPFIDLDEGDEGAALLFYGPVSGELDALDADLRLLGSEGARFGYSLAGADLDQDGYSDLLIGAPSSAEAADTGGAVWIWYGRGG